jgi:ribonuclease HII
MADLEIEKTYGNVIIAGVDEAGRGPIAGPVVAAAVIIDQQNIITGIRDSKKISKKNREELYNWTLDKTFPFG